MNHTINKDTLENAVQMSQGIVVHDLETLNKIVGDSIIQLASHDVTGSLNVKSAVEKVAKDKFEQDYGSRQISWVDYATKFSEDLDGSPFLLDEMLAGRLERS